MEDLKELSLKELAYRVENDPSEREAVTAELWRRREDVENEVWSARMDVKEAERVLRYAVDEQESLYELLGELDPEELESFREGQAEAMEYAATVDAEYDWNQQ